MYKVEWTEWAKKDLKKIERLLAEKIAYEVENHLVKNPTKLGKPLTGERKGQWRYRFSKLSSYLSNKTITTLNFGDWSRTPQRNLLIPF